MSMREHADDRVVSDDGIGQVGNDIGDNPKSGLGTRIITQLVEQIEGKMTIHNEAGFTTEIRFIMPGQS
jgi:two-component sensor histidine kinase